MLFEDQATVRAGGPVFDYLNGSAAGDAGGRSRHEVEAQAGLTRGGLGARLTATWRSGTTVTGGALSSTGDLTFSDLTTVNLRLFADLGQQRELIRRHPWLRGSRVTLAAENLFGQRTEVRDAAGRTPIGYQPAYLDPEGRILRLSFRKVFF